MKLKKWLKCLLMTMALILAVNVGTTAAVMPAAAKAKTETVKKGTKFWSGKLQYKVTSLKGKTGTASLIDAKTSVTSVTVPKTVKKGKYTLTVTEIGANAFKDCKKLKKVVTNTKIKKIGKNAFSGCKKLETVDIKSKELSSVGKNALKGISKDAVVSVPKGMEASYEKKLNVPVQDPETEAAKPQSTPKSQNTAANAQAPASQVTKAPETEAPKVVQKAPASQVTKETKAPETEAPKVVQKATVSQATKETKVQTEAPKAAQTTPQTEAPKTVQTEAPKAPQTEAPKAPQTEAPKATETEAPAQTETEHVCEFTWVVTKEPYCGYLGNDMTWRDTGTKVGTCEICGKTVKKGLRMDHNFVVTKTVEPTCTEYGATYLKCANCGMQSVIHEDEDGNPMEPLGHSLEHYDVPATCTEDGRSYDMCSRCGAVENETVTAEKTGHDFASGEAIVVREPTCVQDGLRETACQHAGCTEKKSERIPATGHEFQTERVAATCYQDETIVTTCAKCNYKSIQTITGTKKPHTMAEESRTESTTVTQGSVKRVCTNDGCGYVETETLPVKKCEHSWVHVSGEEGDREGALASMSNGRIRTERCTNCQEMRYAYNPSGDEETWVPWSEVPCNGAGHKWGETQENGHVYCDVCGTPKPEGDYEADKGVNPRARIVWSANFKADPESCVGFELPGGGRSYSAVLTTISGDSHLKVPAPAAHSGYKFEKWTWIQGSDVPESCFAKNDDGSVDKTTLLLSCDQMDMTFTAHYSKVAEAQEPANSISAIENPDPTEIPDVIHGEMHVDLSESFDDDSSDEESSEEEHVVIEHDELLEESEDTTVVGTEMTE